MIVVCSVDRGVSIIGKSLNFVDQGETDFKEVIEEQMRIHSESMSIFSNEDVRKSLGSDNGSFYISCGGTASGGDIDYLMSPQDSGSFRQAPIDLPKLEQLVPLKKSQLSSTLSEPLPIAAIVCGSGTSTVFVPPASGTAIVGGAGTASIGSTSRPNSEACSMHRSSLVSQDSFIRGIALAQHQGSLTSQESIPRGVIAPHLASLASQTSISTLNVGGQESLARGIAQGSLLSQEPPISRSIITVPPIISHDSIPAINSMVMQGNIIGPEPVLHHSNVLPGVNSSGNYNIVKQDSYSSISALHGTNLTRQDSIGHGNAQESISYGTSQPSSTLTHQDSLNRGKPPDNL